MSAFQNRGEDRLAQLPVCSIRGTIVARVVLHWEQGKGLALAAITYPLQTPGQQLLQVSGSTHWEGNPSE